MKLLIPASLFAILLVVSSPSSVYSEPLTSIMYPDYTTHPLFSTIPTSPSSYSSFDASRAESLSSLSTKSCYLNPYNSHSLGAAGYKTLSFTSNPESAALFANIQQTLQPIIDSIKSTRPHSSLSQTIVNVDATSLPPPSLAVYESAIVDLLHATPGAISLIQSSLNSADFSVGISMVHATDASDFDLYMRGLPPHSNPTRLNNAHVDVGTCGVVKAIIYLSDVNSISDGPFSYVPDSAKLMLDDPSGDPSSHSLFATMGLVRRLGGDWADDESRTNLMTKVPPQHRHKSAVGLDHASDSPFLKAIDENEVKVLGPAGTATFFDSMGIHHGGECEKDGERFVLQVVFGLRKDVPSSVTKPLPVVKPGPPIEVPISGLAYSSVGITASTHFFDVEDTVAAIGGSEAHRSNIEAALVRHRLQTCREFETYEKERPAQKGYRFEYEMSHSTLFCNYMFALGDTWTNRHAAPLNLLEIGVFEARTASWFLEYLLVHPESQYVGVDPRVAEFAQLNQQFNLEIAAEKGSYVQPTRLLKDFSTIGLPKLLYEQIMKGDDGTFDVIYVDGDHTEGGALFDIDISWQLLKAGGVMIIDDYFEAGAGVSSEKDWVAQKNGQVDDEAAGVRHVQWLAQQVQAAVNSFVKAHADELVVLWVEQQFILRKTVLKSYK
jgi:predicted O-methyltransferase YrrM